MTKALLIKAASSIDADLLKYDEVRFKVNYNAGQEYTAANLIDSTDDLTATFVESDNMTFRNVGSKAVSLLQIDKTKPSSCIVSVRPFNIENITGICRGTSTPGRPTKIYTFYGSNLDVIKHLKNLRGVQLGDTSVSGDISALSGLTNLNNVFLNDTSVSGDISALSGLTNLTIVFLGDTSVSGNISALSRLTNLNNVSLYNTSVSGNISALSRLTNLNNVRLFGTSVSGDISALSGLTNLTNVSLLNTSVSGDISALSSLTNLTNLEIGGTQITGDIKTLADKIAKKNVKHTLIVDVVASGAINTNATYDGNACAQRVYKFSFKTDGTYTVN